MVFFFLMKPRQPRATRTEPLFPYPSLFRSDIGKPQRNTITRRALRAVDMRTLGALLQRPFDHLPHQRAATPTTDGEAVELPERVSIDADAQHRSGRSGICRHQSCLRETRAM